MTAALALPQGLTPDVMQAAAIVAAGWPIGPRPMPCMCGIELGKHLDPSGQPSRLPGGCTGYFHDPVDALALAAAEAADRDVMDDLVEHGDRTYVPSGNRGPRVSDYGSCPRAVWYREQDPKPEGYVPAPVNWRRAVLGRIIHKAAEEARSARYPWRKYEFEIPIPGLEKRGKVDEYDPVTGEVIDDKTCGDPKWAMVGDDGPADDAWGQAFIYGYALEALGWPVQTITIICIHRDTGEEEHFSVPYDPAFALECLDQLVELAMTLDLGVVPPRAGLSSGGFPCGWCEHRRHCWNMDAAEAAGRSPESFTILGPDPDVEIIEWAALESDAAVKAATAADKRKAEAKTLLEGLTPGVYGTAEIIAMSRRMPDYKAAYETAVELLGLPLRYRPDEVPVPKRVDRWIAGKPMRKATRDRLARERKQQTPAPAAE